MYVHVFGPMILAFPYAFLSTPNLKLTDCMCYSHQTLLFSSLLASETLSGVYKFELVWYIGGTCSIIVANGMYM